MDSKVCMQRQKTQNSQHTIEEENEIGKLTLAISILTIKLP